MFIIQTAQHKAGDVLSQEGKEEELSEGSRKGVGVQVPGSTVQCLSGGMGHVTLGERQRRLGPRRGPVCTSFQRTEEAHVAR